jgi:hypothetical protein
LELLARIVVFRSDGALDPTVGTGGLSGLSFRPGRNGAHAVAVDPTDGIIVAGSTNHGIPTSFDIGLARVSLDP